MKKEKLTPDTDIHKAHLSVRALNVLKGANGRNDWWNKGRTVETLRDLSGYSEEEVFRLIGSGRLVFEELKSVIKKAGLTFSEHSNRGDWDVYGNGKKNLFKRMNKKAEGQKWNEKEQKWA